MSEALRGCRVCCPYCGEAIELLVDASAGTQRYIEDCSVCCRPIECLVVRQDAGWHLEVRRDDE
jgi:hypothetical protein